MAKELEDKRVERLRYDTSAARVFDIKVDHESHHFGSKGFPEYLRPPYLYFESVLKRYLSPSHTVLEIGAGSGQHTGSMVFSGASVVATDISVISLKLLKHRFGHLSDIRLHTAAADMESLPFSDVSFDLVVCAGSLSYGDNFTVLNEIYRVLKNGGVFVCVDSLHHNPVYRLNRVINYIRGRRTKSTLHRMPTLSLLSEYESHFGEVDIKFFGSVSYIMPIFSFFFGPGRAERFSGFVDRLVNVRRSAFKFVMVAGKKL